MYRPLTQDELSDKDRSDTQEQFMASLWKIGSQDIPRELEDIGLEITPQYGPYDDEAQNEQIFFQRKDELEPMPEV